MAVFWIVAGLMTAVAMTFVLVPLLRSRPRASPSRYESNLEVLRDQRREIEADVARGLLPGEAKDEALAELVERASADLDSQAPQTASTTRKPWVTVAVTAVAIPALAFGLYAATGNPAASDPKVVAASRPPAHESPDQAQIIAMVETLAAKMRERPDDPRGWALLARSMGTLGRFRESAEAYERLNTLVPNDPDVLADYSDALGMAQGRSLAGKPYELARQALKIDPKHQKALALAGTAALDAGDYAAAATYWESLAAQMPPDSAERVQVQAVIAEVRQRAASSGKPLPQPKALASAPAAAAPKETNVTGSVALAPAMAAQVTGGETLFIFARSEGGPRVPLAVVRATASELPMRFALDDSQAMAPGMNLSSAKAVRIEARVSKSGNAAPQSGDLVGTSDVVKPGARDVKVVVDKVVP